MKSWEKQKEGELWSGCNVWEKNLFPVKIDFYLNLHFFRMARITSVDSLSLPLYYLSLYNNKFVPPNKIIILISLSTED